MRARASPLEVEGVAHVATEAAGHLVGHGHGKAAALRIECGEKRENGEPTEEK